MGGAGDHDHHQNNNNNINSNNVGAGRVTRARARVQQAEPQVVEEEDSFEVPGLMSSRQRRAPPNKVARRK